MGDPGLAPMMMDMTAQSNYLPTHFRRLAYEEIDLYHWLKITAVPGVRIQKFLDFEWVSDGIADVSDARQLNPALPSLPGRPAFQYVLRIPRGRVVGPWGLILTPDNYLLTDVCITGDLHNLNLAKVRHLAVELRRATVQRGNVATIAAHAAGCYFHWLFDILPRVRLLAAAKVPYDRLIHEAIFTDLQRECLAKAEVDSGAVVKCARLEVIEAENLLVPSFLGYSFRGEGIHVEQTIVNWLRGLFATTGNFSRLSPPTRLYLSRAGYPTRRLFNEEELLPILRAHGFRAVFLEKLGLAQQAELLASAEMIIGTHGSALANLVFCRPGTRAIEIRSPRFFGHNFQALAQSLDLEYHHLIAESIGADEQMKLPVQALAELLAALDRSKYSACAARSAPQPANGIHPI